MHETPAAHVLRARALLRLGRPADAASEIDAVLEPMGSHPEDARTLSFEQLGELHTLRATARVRCHRFPDADDSFLSARVYTYSSGNAALEAELAYYEAPYAQAAGARIEFEAWARAVLAVHPEPVSVPARPAYFVPLEHSRARAYDLLGFIAAEAHDFREQARRLRSSLEEFDRTTVRDAWFEAKQLAHLSYYVRDFGDEDVAEYVLQRYGCTEWTAELAAQQQEVLRSLGWSTAMRGDFLSAFVSCVTPPRSRRRSHIRFPRSSTARIFRANCSWASSRAKKSIMPSAWPRAFAGTTFTRKRRSSRCSS